MRHFHLIVWLILKQVIFSIFMESFKSRALCSSSPSSLMTAVPMALWTKSMVATEASDLATSKMIAPYSKLLNPGPRSNPFQCKHNNLPL